MRTIGNKHSGYAFTMAPDRVAIGIVGLGRMGKRHVYNLLSRVPRAQVVAVCTNLPHELEWAHKHQE